MANFMDLARQDKADVWRRAGIAPPPDASTGDFGIGSLAVARRPEPNSQVPPRLAGESAADYAKRLRDAGYGKMELA